ncbi:MAG: tetratricopeptide repeat protein [Bacteroidales bacterium]|nr:tetratricopeptide repeat protein [Bacteroidales bacterium]
MDRKLNDILELRQEEVELSNLLSVERLSEKFPYSAVLHVYAAKFASLLGNQNKEKHLAAAAAYACERAALKHFMDAKLTPCAKTPFQSDQNAVLFEQNAVSVGQNGVLEKPDFEAQKENSDILEEIDRYSEPDLSDNPTKEEVIERFLKIENPKVNTAENSSEDPAIEKIIKQSANDEFKIVTETMAKIYLKQGNKDKALQIYRQLLASNPKKSVYFADRIRELEEE